MEQNKGYFNDSEAYELFMKRWSRAVGVEFLQWIDPPKDVRWLEVGCGTGVFTELILNMSAPANVIGIDPSPTQIDHARRQPFAKQAEFEVADAQQLPFPDDAFDIVTSALVINFIPDRVLGVAEMRRVARPAATVAGYVWDFAGERSPNAPLRIALGHIGLEPIVVPGTTATTIEALHSLFETSGFKSIATRSIDVTIYFPNFEELWRAQTPVYSPTTKALAALSEADRARVMENVRAALRTEPDGSIACTARANAIKASVPA